MSSIDKSVSPNVLDLIRRLQFLEGRFNVVVDCDPYRRQINVTGRDAQDPCFLAAFNDILIDLGAEWQ